MALFGEHKDTAPKRGRKPAATRRAPTRAEQKDAKGVLGFLVGITNFGLTYLGAFSYKNVIRDENGIVVRVRDESQPDTEVLHDPLTEDEAQMAVEALYGELALNPNLVIQAAALAHFGGPHGELMRVATLIALPRLAAREIIPPAIAGWLSMSLIGLKDIANGDIPESSADGESTEDEWAAAAASPAVSLGAGAAYGDHWGNGNGQIDGGQPAAADSGLHPDSANGAGPKDALPRRRGKQPQTNAESSNPSDTAASEVATLDDGPDSGTRGAE